MRMLTAWRSFGLNVLVACVLLSGCSTQDAHSPLLAEVVQQKFSYAGKSFAIRVPLGFEAQPVSAEDKVVFAPPGSRQKRGPGIFAPSVIVRFNTTEKSSAGATASTIKTTHLHSGRLPPMCRHELGPKMVGGMLVSVEVLTFAKDKAQGRSLLQQTKLVTAQ